MLFVTKLHVCSVCTHICLSVTIQWSYQSFICVASRFYIYDLQILIHFTNGNFVTLLFFSNVERSLRFSESLCISNLFVSLTLKNIINSSVLHNLAVASMLMVLVLGIWFVLFIT